MTSLTKFAESYIPSLIGGLAGTAIGAGGGYFGTSQRLDETEEDYKTRRSQNMGTGAIAGAAAGAGAPILAKHLTPSPPPPPATGARGVAGSVLNRLFNIEENPSTAGAVIGGAGGAAGVSAAMATKERLAKGMSEWDRYIERIKNTQGKPPGVINQMVSDAEALRSADQNKNFIRKLFGTAEEKALMAAQAPKAHFAGRRGGRWGALIGALGGTLGANWAFGDQATPAQ